RLAAYLLTIMTTTQTPTPTPTPTPTKQTPPAISNEQIDAMDLDTLLTVAGADDPETAGEH
ncbi:MAG TPA: hypothetical protein VJT49_00680, partial [Amycolatopsis sp.]|uniref:hypothetical protein n=1 Tax=Amycolatopsis sp. TaxID=37632 RepID=UPI002B480087